MEFIAATIEKWLNDTVLHKFIHLALQFRAKILHSLRSKSSPEILLPARVNSIAEPG